MNLYFAYKCYLFCVLFMQILKFMQLQVVLSHHCEEANATQYPENVQKKPDITRIVGDNEVEFSDGSCCGFDTILFCTGYRYSFPFLNASCGITVENNHIQPLYKHMINIDKPTMCFIGIPFNVCAFQMFDLQVLLTQNVF